MKVNLEQQNQLDIGIAKNNLHFRLKHQEGDCTIPTEVVIEYCKLTQFLIYTNIANKNDQSPLMCIGDEFAYSLNSENEHHEDPEKNTQSL